MDILLEYNSKLLLEEFASVGKATIHINKYKLFPYTDYVPSCNTNWLSGWCGLVRYGIFVMFTNCLFEGSFPSFICKPMIIIGNFSFCGQMRVLLEFTEK